MKQQLLVGKVFWRFRVRPEAKGASDAIFRKEIRPEKFECQIATPAPWQILVFAAIGPEHDKIPLWPPAAADHCPQNGWRR
jgi:hypothetical protein